MLGGDHGVVVAPLFNPPREEEQQSTQGQPTEWQRIGNQIDAAFIFARAHFVKKKLYVLRSYP
jgi:hypothetical protein